VEENEKAPRISPLPESEWSDGQRELLDAILLDTFGSPAPDVPRSDDNVFTTLVRHEGLFKVWLRFGGFLLSRGELPARERELLILRAGFNCGSDYEWGQHARLAEKLGLPREEIDRVAAGPDAEGWSEADSTLLRAADELHEAAKISDETWALLAETYGERALIEIPMVVGHYTMLAFALNSLGVAPDDGLEPLPE
jgi:4-carboxymuconolactone decarboxylase